MQDNTREDLHRTEEYRPKEGYSEVRKRYLKG
jgi:hypothetical protein